MIAEDLLARFFGQPLHYWQDYGLKYIISCEAVHFLFSAYAGVLGFLLMQTILSHRQHKWEDPYIFRCSLFFGCCLAVTGHIVLDLIPNFV